MSFLFETFKIPLWFLIFAFACAAPLWIRWYKKFYKKFIVKDILTEKYSEEKVSTKDTVDVFKKASDHWDSSVVEKKKRGEEVAKASSANVQNTENQPYVKIVLKMLALKGDAGMLIQSIADELNVKSNDVKSSLSYLEKNDFVESVAGGYGTKYYLTPRGKKYCAKRGYISE